MGAVVAIVAVSCGSGSDADPEATAGSPASATAPASTAATSAPDADPNAPDVMADDGSAGLIIPDGALPAGVTVDQITMTRLTDDAYADALAYELQPTGLDFAVPLTLTAVVEDSSGALPFVLAIDDEGEVSLVDGVTLEYDLETDSVAIAAPVAHFSRYGVWEKGVVEIDTQSGLRQFNVGDVFLFQVTIKYGEGYSNNVSDDKFLLEVSPARDEPFSVNPVGPSKMLVINGRIQPASFLIPTELNVKGSYVHDQVLACVSDGAERLLDDERIRVDFTAIITTSAINSRSNIRTNSHAASMFLRLKDNYICVGGGMRISPPPYTVICDNGKTFSGFGPTLADGRVIDAESRKFVTCQ